MTMPNTHVVTVFVYWNSKAQKFQVRGTDPPGYEDIFARSISRDGYFIGSPRGIHVVTNEPMTVHFETVAGA